VGPEMGEWGLGSGALFGRRVVWCRVAVWPVPDPLDQTVLIMIDVSSWWQIFSDTPRTAHYPK